MSKTDGTILDTADTTLIREREARPVVQDAPQAVNSNSNKPSKFSDGLDYHALNAMLNLYDDEGKSSLIATGRPRGSISSST